MTIIENEVTTIRVDLTDNEAEGFANAAALFQQLSSKYRGRTMLTDSNDLDTFYTAEELWLTAKVLFSFADCPKWIVD